jgi:kynureninase
MRDEFDPLPGAEGWQLSNPPILPLAAMRASMEIFDQAGIQNLRHLSIEFINKFYDLLKDFKGIEIITPANPEERGCQLSLHVKKEGRKLFDYLNQRGIIADWREPDVIRIAPVPLYNTMDDLEYFIYEMNAF